MLFFTFHERRTRAAVEAACQQIGLARDATRPDGDVRTGSLDDVEILVTTSRTALVGSPFAAAVPKAPVTLVARLPAPLGFTLKLARAPFWSDPSLSTGDEALAKELLASPMLRRRIRLFLQRARAGHAIATDAVVVRNVFGAHRVSGVAAIVRAASEAAALAKAVSRRDAIRRGQARPTEQERLEDLLIARLETTLRGFEDLLLSVGGPVPEGTPLAKALGFADWITPAEVLSVETPAGLPRRPIDARSPAGLVRVEVACDEGGFHDSRNTWYSYNGYHLWLLVFGDSGEIWDARWERTD